MKSKWGIRKLGDLCNISSSKRIFAREYCSKGVPFYRGKEIIEKHKGNAVSTELFISEERYAEIKEKNDVPRIGDILLSSVGTLGVPWLVDEEKFYFKDGNLTWLRVGEELDNKFLYLWLCSPEAKQQIDAKCIGSTQKAITIDALSKFDICIPSIETQQKISNLLFAIINKIVLNKMINDNLQEQAQAIYSNMFIQNTSEQWKEGILFDVANITMGQSPKGDTYNEEGIGTVFFQGRGEFGFRFPTRRLFTTDPKRMAQTNDVLMSVRAPVGDLNVAYEPCCIGRGLGAIRSKDNHQSFVLYTVFSLREKLDMFNGEGTVFGSINRDALNLMPIIIPSKEEMDRFEEIAAPMDVVIRNNYEEICRLEAIRDSLLSRLMSGELDVSDLDL